MKRRTPVITRSSDPYASRRIDLTGQTFGLLTVIDMIPAKPWGKRHCRCRCACGQETRVRIDHLRRGEAQSCGCQTRRDLRGQRFGDLLVLEQAENILVGQVWLTAWLCQCKCGRRVILGTHRLVAPRHPATHCGCRRLLPAAPETTVEEAPLPSRKPTTAGEALRRFHDTTSPLGAVRVVARAVEETDDDSRCLHDFDPFAKWED